MVKYEELKKLRENNKELEGRINEITKDAKVFTAKAILEEILKIFNDVKKRNVAS